MYDYEQKELNEILESLDFRGDIPLTDTTIEYYKINDESHEGYFDADR